MKAGILDNFKAMFKRINETFTGLRSPYGVPRMMLPRSKYKPHQGRREKARRVLQLERWWSGKEGCKLGPSSRGL